MKANHAVNVVLWQPGEQILNLQTDKQTDNPNDYYTRGRPRAPRVISKIIMYMYLPRLENNNNTSLSLDDDY